MKTSEFVKKLQDLGLRVEKEGDIFKVFPKYNNYDNEDYWFVIGDIGYSSSFIQTNKFRVFRKEHINVLNIAIEYIDTPLEEREEEKRYLLKVVLNSYYGRGLYVYWNHALKQYFIAPINMEYYQNIFTQKEIDAMPFDTNFFIKEEVK